MFPQLKDKVIRSAEIIHTVNHNKHLKIFFTDGSILEVFGTFFQRNDEILTGVIGRLNGKTLQRKE